MNEYKEKIKLWECYKGEFPISQEFGKHFYNQDGKCVYVLMGFDGHNGIDFALPIGTKLIAISDGKVSKAIHQKNGYGNHLRLHCSQGDTNFEVIYAHCIKFLVKQGESVSKGQIIAESGNSGFSSGPHLHFGVRILDEGGNVLNHANGYKGSIDPLPLFDLSESNSPNKQIEEKINFNKMKIFKNNSSTKIYFVGIDNKKHWIKDEKTFLTGKEVGFWGSWDDVEVIDDDPYAEGDSMFFVSENS